MKVEVTLLKCSAVGATGSLILGPFMYFQIWQGNLNVIKDGFDVKCRSWAEKIFTGLIAGHQHVSSCQAQLPTSKAAPWVGAVCSGSLHLLRWSFHLCFDRPEALLNISLSLDYSALPPLLCLHNTPLWALIFFCPSLSFEWIKVIWCEIAWSPCRTEIIFWTTGNWLFLREYFSPSTKKKQILYLHFCLFFPPWKMGHFFYRQAFWIFRLSMQNKSSSTLKYRQLGCYILFRETQE